MKKIFKSIDGNNAAAHIAYAFSEISALYPITPSTGMGEWVDEWASQGKKNLFGEIVSVVEMQSEAGAAGALHGALSSGAFATTFTASQGLLLMIPNMYKIAGELMPCVFHVSARAIAGQALSIFGDHQDVMATRSSGFCMLSSHSVQEAQDMALVAHLASLRLSLPFVHFFDGFRTSHEIQKVNLIDYEEIRPLVDWQAVQNHRRRALNPEHPHLRGSAQNTDIYFQATERANPFYAPVAKIVEEEMDKLDALTHRRYHLFDYLGHPQAERVIILMGSGAQTVEETVQWLMKKGERVGVVKVHLFRPFSIEHFRKALPSSVKKIAVLDRTKEAASFGEPLYLDVCSALRGSSLDIIGGRFGLGGKEFTPSMVKALFDHLKESSVKNHFTLGINDDVTHTSLAVKEIIDTEDPKVVRCKFWGIGGDGTIGANKDAIKIIGDHTGKQVQGYFAYDSKKSSGVTVSHLRFGDTPILSTYLIQVADYIACHHPSYVLKYDVLEGIKKGGTFVLNCPWTLQEMEDHLPASLKRVLALQEVKFYTIDASQIAKSSGLGEKINMVMQAVFFKLSDILPIDLALSLLKAAIAETYFKKGEAVILRNQQAVDLTIQNLKKIDVPSSWKNAEDAKSAKEEKPAFIEKVADVMNAQKGDTLPVSAFDPGGILPPATTQYEKRNIALNLPEWIRENCIQCNQCSFVCPHAVIRPFLLSSEEAKKAPKSYQSVKAIGKGGENYQYSIQVSPYDCTGCGNCVETCPAPKGKALVLKPESSLRPQYEECWDFFRKKVNPTLNLSKYTVKGSQLCQPLMEFSGACAGCGETPYVKLLTQLFGNRMIVANATGCSSIWGGSSPSVPWAVNEKGYGPAWANSLFEDNAEYGFGMHMAFTYRRRELARWVSESLKTDLPSEVKKLFEDWLLNKEEGEKSYEIAEAIKTALSSMKRGDFLEKIWERKDLLTKPSIWTIGGDGWAYDIGYGGLDHVLSMNQDVKVLVLDTEVYSNTGGQSSKATPMGAVAKFAASGKKTAKKDLGLIAMSYGTIYVASVSMGADKQQLLLALQEAESYKGPALIIAYASCIAHGNKWGMSRSQNEMKLAVESGYWFNYRFDPRRKAEGKNPFQLDSKKPTLSLQSFLSEQVRYNYLQKTKPEEAKKLLEELEAHLKEKYEFFEKLSAEKSFF
jgi:pyruvate-ferredoxin/flavodoxin oxidoreductase